MFDDFGIKKKKVKKYILNYYNSRGQIIKLLSLASGDYSFRNIQYLIKEKIDQKVLTLKLLI